MKKNELLAWWALARTPTLHIETLLETDPHVSSVYNKLMDDCLMKLKPSEQGKS